MDHLQPVAPTDHITAVHMKICAALNNLYPSLSLSSLELAKWAMLAGPGQSMTLLVRSNAACRVWVVTLAQRASSPRHGKAWLTRPATEETASSSHDGDVRRRRRRVAVEARGGNGGFTRWATRASRPVGLIVPRSTLHGP